MLTYSIGKEIKVGDYIRTKEWGIAKVDKIDNGKVTFIKNKNNRRTHYFTQIGEPSENLINLIEVGDYVNRHLVVEISKNVYNQKVIITEVDGKDGAIRRHYLERSIKSIVTHEQFKLVEYEV